MNSIFISDEAGNIVDLSKLFDRIEKLEKRVPLFDIPKTRKKMKSERIKFIERQLLKTAK